jgi:hypothetical protein
MVRQRGLTDFTLLKEKPMRYTLIAAVLYLLTAVVSADQTADSCTACHKASLSLESWQAADLEARVREFLDGRAQHVAPIPRLADEELEALVAALAGS